MPAAQRRVQLIDVAQSLFAVHGYHHISMDDIAAAAHVTKPVLYKHFPSKLDLYLAAVEDRGQDLTARVTYSLDQAAQSTAVTGRMIVRAVIDSYVAFVRDCGVQATLLFESDVTRDEATREKINAPNTHIAATVATVLTRVAAVSPQQALHLARTTVALAQHTATSLSARVSLSAEDCTDHIETATAFAWGGLTEALSPHTPQ